MAKERSPFKKTMLKWECIVIGTVFLAYMLHYFCTVHLYVVLTHFKEYFVPGYPKKEDEYNGIMISLGYYASDKALLGIFVDSYLRSAVKAVLIALVFPPIFSVLFALLSFENVLLIVATACVLLFATRFVKLMLYAEAVIVTFCFSISDFRTSGQWKKQKEENEGQKDNDDDGLRHLAKELGTNEEKEDDDDDIDTNANNGDDIFVDALLNQNDLEQIGNTRIIRGFGLFEDLDSESINGFYHYHVPSANELIEYDDDRKPSNIIDLYHHEERASSSSQCVLSSDVIQQQFKTQTFWCCKHRNRTSDTHILDTTPLEDTKTAQFLEHILKPYVSFMNDHFRNKMHVNDMDKIDFPIVYDAYTSLLQNGHHTKVNSCSYNQCKILSAHRDDDSSFNEFKRSHHFPHIDPGAFSVDEEQRIQSMFVLFDTIHVALQHKSVLLRNTRNGKQSMRFISNLSEEKFTQSNLISNKYDGDGSTTKRDMYSYGVQVEYGYDGEASYEGAVTIQPLYSSFKEELLSNTLCVLNIHQYNQEYEKAMHYISAVWRMISYPHLLLEHILALIIHCDNDHLNYEFSKTFRDGLIRRISEFYYLGMNLKRAVHEHGTRIKDGAVKRFYYGVDKEFLFPSYFNDIYIGFPFSTTYKREVATIFTAGSGLIAEFGDMYGYNKYFDVQCLSAFRNECECLMFQLEFPLTINNITTVSGSQLENTLKSLKVITELLNFQPINPTEHDRYKESIAAIFHYQKGGGNETDYVSFLISMVFKRVTQLEISYDWIQWQCPWLLSFFFHSISSINIESILVLFPNIQHIIIHDIWLSPTLIAQICTCESFNHFQSIQMERMSNGMNINELKGLKYDTMFVVDEHNNYVRLHRKDCIMPTPSTCTFGSNKTYVELSKYFESNKVISKLITSVSKYNEKNRKYREDDGVKLTRLIELFLENDIRDPSFSPENNHIFEILQKQFLNDPLIPFIRNEMISPQIKSSITELEATIDSLRSVNIKLKEQIENMETDYESRIKALSLENHNLKTIVSANGSTETLTDYQKLGRFSVGEALKRKYNYEDLLEDDSDYSINTTITMLGFEKHDELLKFNGNIDFIDDESQLESITFTLMGDPYLKEKKQITFMINNNNGDLKDNMDSKRVSLIDIPSIQYDDELLQMNPEARSIQRMRSESNNNIWIGCDDHEDNRDRLHMINSDRNIDKSKSKIATLMGNPATKEQITFMFNSNGSTIIDELNDNTDSESIVFTDLDIIVPKHSADKLMDNDIDSKPYHYEESVMSPDTYAMVDFDEQRTLVPINITCSERKEYNNHPGRYIYKGKNGAKGPSNKCTNNHNIGYNRLSTVFEGIPNAQTPNMQVQLQHYTNFLWNELIAVNQIANGNIPNIPLPQMFNHSNINTNYPLFRYLPQINNNTYSIYYNMSHMTPAISPNNNTFTLQPPFNVNHWQRTQTNQTAVWHQPTDHQNVPFINTSHNTVQYPPSLSKEETDTKRNKCSSTHIVPNNSIIHSVSHITNNVIQSSLDSVSQQKLDQLNDKSESISSINESDKQNTIFLSEFKHTTEDTKHETITIGVDPLHTAESKKKRGYKKRNNNKQPTQHETQSIMNKNDKQKRFQPYPQKNGANTTLITRSSDATKEDPLNIARMKRPKRYEQQQKSNKKRNKNKQNAKYEYHQPIKCESKLNAEQQRNRIKSIQEYILNEKWWNDMKNAYIHRRAKPKGRISIELEHSDFMRRCEKRVSMIKKKNNADMDLILIPIHMKKKADDTVNVHYLMKLTIKGKGNYKNKHQIDIGISFFSEYCNGSWVVNVSGIHVDPQKIQCSIKDESQHDLDDFLSYFIIEDLCIIYQCQTDGYYEGKYDKLISFIGEFIRNHNHSKLAYWQHKASNLWAEMVGTPRVS